MLEYQNNLKENNLIDFDDIILLSTKLVNKTSIEQELEASANYMESRENEKQ